VNKITIWLFAVVAYGAAGGIIVHAQGVESCPSYNALWRSVKQSSCLKLWGWDDFPDPHAPPTLVCWLYNGSR
jgi:hypothetical protein